MDVPWIIIKGISDYADCRKSGTDRWRSFASLMAASLTAHVLSDPVVFQDWHHYNETGEYYNKLPVTGIFHLFLHLTLHQYIVLQIKLQFSGLRLTKSSLNH